MSETAKERIDTGKRDVQQARFKHEVRQRLEDIQSVLEDAGGRVQYDLKQARHGADRHGHGADSNRHRGNFRQQMASARNEQEMSRRLGDVESSLRHVQRNVQRQHRHGGVQWGWVLLGAVAVVILDPGLRQRVLGWLSRVNPKVHDAVEPAFGRADEAEQNVKDRLDEAGQRIREFPDNARNMAESKKQAEQQAPPIQAKA